MLLSEFKTGEELEVKELKRYSGHRKKWVAKQGVIVQATDRFVVVDYGNYRGTISFGEVKTGQVKVVRRNTEMAEKIFTKERLTELCREHGFGKAAYEKIAEIIGSKSWQSVEFSVRKMGIKKELEGEQGAAEEPQFQISEEEPIEKKEDLIERGVAAADFMPVKVASSLKPMSWISEITGMKYERWGEAVEIITLSGDDDGITIRLENLDTFIRELEELREVI